MVPLTDEQFLGIRSDLIYEYQYQYGDKWIDCLTKNLKASPYEAISEKYGVPKKAVSYVKHQIWVWGKMMKVLSEIVNEDIESLEDA